MSIFTKILSLELDHDKPNPKIITEKNIKLGLRNQDGTGVRVGLTSKGQVIGQKKVDKSSVPVEGRLFYCGYDLNSVVEGIQKEGRFGFDEVTWLLLTGELPNSEDLSQFSDILSRMRSLPEEEIEFLRRKYGIEDPMNDLQIAVSHLYHYPPLEINGFSNRDYDHNSVDITTVSRQSLDIIAKMPTLVAYNYNSKKGRELVSPRSDLRTAENFLYMLNGQVPDEKLAKLFDLCLMLHAEHGGGNNSTFSTRVVSSAQTNTYMAISTGIASLAGHLHGGANEKVMQMIKLLRDEVKDLKDDEEIRCYLGNLVNKAGKIYGIGHSVYTLSDPRAILLHEKAREAAEATGKKDEFDLFERVARIAPQVILKEKGKIANPNVDFYSGFIYSCMGIPEELFTPIFAMSRVSGWCAHRIEELVQGKLIRPAYVSSLERELEYVPLLDRI